jgi:hypothetical protein
MKKVGAVLGAFALAGLVAACDQGPSVFAPDELNIGVSSPGTAVNANLTIASGVTVESGPSVHGNGTCEAGGAFRNNGGNLASGPLPHTNCVDTTAGSEVVVTFTLQANYVQPRSGNIHLNFSICGYVEVPVLDENGEEVLDDNDDPVLQWIVDPCTEPAFIHFQKNKNFTEGSGSLFGRGSDGQQWEIDLEQVGHNTSLLGTDEGIENTRKRYRLIANVVGAAANNTHVATLTW